MKNLIQITTVLFLLIQTIGYSQTKKTDTISNKQDTNLKQEIDTEKFKAFIGSYFLEEANETLSIIQEKGKLYLADTATKNLLTKKNDTTLYEEKYGVFLELIKSDKNGLKFTQNGYETTIKRVATNN